MCVCGVDERGHDDAALGVDDLGVGILGAKHRFLADFDDLRAFEGDGAVLITALRVCVAGDETTVGDKFHKFAPPFFFCLFPAAKRHRKGKEKALLTQTLSSTPKGETVQPVREALRCSYQTVI